MSTDQTTGNASTGRPEDYKPSPGLSAAYGLQHVLTMSAGLLAVPLIVGHAAGLAGGDIALLITATFFMAGLATMLQTLGLPYLGAQLPLVQGTSFAAVSAMTAIVTTGGGIQAVFGAVIAASIFGIIFAPIFSKIIRFFPPVVTGSVITIIGVSLFPVASAWAMGGHGAPDYGAMSHI